jgi:Na+-driven multidrug efflux pump
MVPYMLRMMSTPDDVFDGAALYLRIYFYGVTGLLIYNMGSGILRAVGDSRRPLYFLIFSALVNTVLDLVFVICFGWGIAGVAIATIIAQFLSAALVLYVLTRTTGCYRIIWNRILVSGTMLNRIWKIGLPSALQQASPRFPTFSCSRISTSSAPPAWRAGRPTPSWTSLYCCPCSPWRCRRPRLWDRTSEPTM